MDDFHFHSPAEIILGLGVIKRLGLIAAPFGSRALLVTEDILSDSGTPLLVQDLLIKRGIECLIFDEIGTGSTSRAAEKAIAIARGSHAQIVIGLGGIRTLSIAKSVAGISPVSLFMDNYSGDIEMDAPPLNYIEIPTTCRNPFMLRDDALVIDAKNRKPRILKIRGNFAKVVVIDPELTLSLSEKYVTSTLLDTFLSSVEGYLSKTGSFLSDTIFLKSIGIITSIFQEITRNPDNMELRLSASRAGLLSAFGLSMSSQGLGSAVAYAAGALFMIPKSIISTMMIPYVLEYGNKVSPQKVAKMAPILDQQIDRSSIREASERVVEIMRTKIGLQEIPMRLKDFNLDIEDITAVSDAAASFRMLRNLPSAVSAQEIFEILKNVL